MEENIFLLLLDTSSIQNYIFKTNKLKEIRGASALLNSLNLKMTPQLIEKYFKKTNLCKDYELNYLIDDTIQFCEFENLDCWVLSFGGGSTRILYQDKAETKANDFLKEIEKKYKEETALGTTIQHVIVSQKDSGEILKLTQKAEIKLKLIKQNSGSLSQIATNPFTKFCSSSGTEISSRISAYDNAFISPQVEAKQNVSNRSLYFTQFANSIRHDANTPKFVHEYLGSEGKGKEKFIPADITQIGKKSKPNGYIGLIYADGNRMGFRMQQHFNSHEEITQFSEEVKKATLKALFDSLKSLVINETDYFPFEILFVGGDDILLIVPAQYTFEFALEFTEKFENLTKYTNSRSGVETHVSLGVGIAIAHANHPLQELYELTKSLASSSKNKSQKINVESEGAKDLSCFNYVINKGSSVKDFNEIEETELQFKDIVNNAPITIKLSKRPYTHEELRNAMASVRGLKNVKTPRTKLSQLYNALHQGWAQGTLDSLRIISRLPNDVKTELFENFSASNIFPWQRNSNGEYETPVVDWIELFDFVS